MIRKRCLSSQYCRALWLPSTQYCRFLYLRSYVFPSYIHCARLLSTSAHSCYMQLCYLFSFKSLCVQVNFTLKQIYCWGCFPLNQGGMGGWLGGHRLRGILLKNNMELKGRSGFCLMKSNRSPQFRCHSPNSALLRRPRTVNGQEGGAALAGILLLFCLPLGVIWHVIHVDTISTVFILGKVLLW